MVRTNSRLLPALIFGVAVLAVIVFSSITQNANTQNSKWKVGQHVEVYYIDRSTGKMAWRKATVVEVFNWGAHVKFDDDGEIESIQNDNIRATGATENSVPDNPQPGVEKSPAKGKSSAEGCASDSGIAEKPKANSSLEKIFKHVILENYEAEINGSTTSPLKVGVTFQEFEIGQATVNRVTRNGVEYPSATVGAKIYPVKTKHTLCRLYNGGPTQTLFEGRYACFKDKQGDWVCPTAPGHKILGYQ
jgi:hypothetical protein